MPFFCLRSLDDSKMVTSMFQPQKSSPRIQKHPPEIFCKKGVLNIFAKFSLFLTKLQALALQFY